MRITTTTHVLVGTLVTLLNVSARADERAILADIKAFFETTDLDRREQIVQRIQADPAYDRAKVGKWLHRAKLFDNRQPGRDELRVELPGGKTRTVALRIPPKYTPARAYPLIYALHGSGGNGANFIRYVEYILGEAVNKYIVAAPSQYAPTFTDTAGRPNAEHPAVLLALKKHLHVDSDRVYVLGYSLGGHATWNLAVLHADQFAAAMPVAGSFVLVGANKLWDAVLPNVMHLPVLMAWGAHDTAGPAPDEGSPGGGVAGLNRLLAEHATRLGLPVTTFEDPEKGHGDIYPPRPQLLPLLRKKREQHPRQVQHTFRHTYQAQAYWLEGHAWKGSHWGSSHHGNIELRPNEDPQDALLRVIRSKLGELRGTIDGQTIDVRRKKITELTIWIGDGMIDWNEPVTVKVSANTVFEDKLEADLFVCLTQAARTYDFDRLRWAGLRFKSGYGADPVTGRTEFPPPAEPP